MTGRIEAIWSCVAPDGSGNMLPTATATGGRVASPLDEDQALRAELTRVFYELNMALALAAASGFPIAVDVVERANPYQLGERYDAVVESGTVRKP